MFKTMRKMLLVILALVLFACVASAAQAEEQGLVTVPALSAGFGPSLQAANMSFLLAAFAVDAQGSPISCGSMARYAGKEFYIPRTALFRSAAELKAAYFACLVQANAAAAIKMAVPVPSAARAAGGTTTATTQTTTTTSTTTTAATTATTVRDLEQKLKAAQTRLSEVQAAAEKRFAEIRVEEQAETARQLKKMEAEFEKKLAAAQAAAGKQDPKLAELEEKIQRLELAKKVLEEENSTLKNKLAARGGVPPGPSRDWDGIFKAVGLKHHVKKVVQDPQLLAAKQAAEKRISERQARGGSLSCALLLSTPSIEMPSEFSMYQSIGEDSRADCKAAAANPYREVEVLAWNPIVVVGYPLLFAALAFAWPGYRAFRRYLNPVGDLDLPTPVVDVGRIQRMQKDPAFPLHRGELEKTVFDTLQRSLPNSIAAACYVRLLSNGSLWIRTDNRRQLSKVLKVMTEHHPSLVIKRKPRQEKDRFCSVLYQKYNSQAPGTCATA